MRVLALCLSLSFLVACGSVLLAQKQVSDDEIYDNVRRRLANDPDVKGGTFEVQVEAGVVTIRGTVEKDQFKSKAERLAKKVRGVRKVVNQLQIKTKSRNTQPRA
ncbi:MAG: BON domain-containing protein [Acidobacteria bacterium]|nr:BON domain-containing protein [Acidobacteriota bacterium]